MGDRFDLAIWLESDELSQVDQGNGNDDEPASDSSGIHVHLNFWKLPKCNAIDIGINFPLFTHGSVNLFINTNEEIVGTDITPDLKRDDIINTIFNEFISTASCPKQTECRKAERAGKRLDAFCICCFSNPLSKKRFAGGTLIKFNISNKDCDKSCGCLRQYIRLRLTGKAVKNIYVKDNIPSSQFQYYTSNINFLDFRLNNARSLPQSILEYRKRYPILSCVRCFVMLESGEELLLHNKEYKKVRVIEKDKWYQYLDEIRKYIKNPNENKIVSFFKWFTPNGKKRNKVILAYQWNLDEPSQEFSLFTKIKRSELSWKTFLLYAVFAFFIGFVPSIIASCAYESLK